MATPVNATGWSELMNTHMIKATYVMYDSAFGNLGLVVVILFIVHQLMLYAKTQNITLMWTIGVIFAALYASSQFVEPMSVKIIFFILVFELASIMYMLMFSK